MSFPSRSKLFNGRDPLIPVCYTLTYIRVTIVTCITLSPIPDSPTRNWHDLFLAPVPILIRLFNFDDIESLSYILAKPYEMLSDKRRILEKFFKDFLVFDLLRFRNLRLLDRIARCGAVITQLLASQRFQTRLKFF